MGHDPIKYALWIGGFSLAITFACGAYVAWVNGGSRNLALGLGALAGACVILVLQIVFELKGSETSSDFAVEFVFDHGQKSVRSSRAYDQSPAAASSYRNLLVETEASNTVAATTPPLTRDDAPNVIRDLGIVSILAYLLDEQSDWQLETRSFKTGIGTSTQWSRLSKPKECSLFSADDIRKKLHEAGNIFADVRIGMMGEQGSLCLPPHGALEITQNSIAVRSLVSSMVVTLTFSMMTTIDPHAVADARSTKQPIKAGMDALPDGSPRYTTVVFGARTTIELAPLRAQDRDLDKYLKWTSRVVEGLKARFEWPD